MKKPHQQEWHLDSAGDVCRDGESLATHTNATTEEMRLIKAAPKMARALLAVLAGERDDSGHLCLSFEEEDRLRDVLREAGVPLECAR